MNASQIKDEIRKLNRIEQIEIWRWLDRETVDDLVNRIGRDRSLQIRREIEENVYQPGRLGKGKRKLGESDHDALVSGRPCGYW